MPLEVAKYYASLNVLSILPIELPCKMDAFGIIRQKDHLLSPGAELLLNCVRAAAKDMYADQQPAGAALQNYTEGHTA
jgi:hypothetical protein